VPRYSAPPAAAPPAAAAPPHQPGRVLRGVALTAVSIGVLVLAAAAFVLSYPGLHAVARQAGISAPLARGYPVILDAMLVIACAAVLSLRGAGAVSKFYAWLSLLVLLGATAGADALHSTGTVVPHKDAAFAAAVLPWVLVLIGFGLLLAMMRHFRLHRLAPAAAAASPPAPAEERRPAALPPGPTPTAGPAQLAAAAPVPPVPGPPVAAPQRAAAPGPDIPAQWPAPEPAAAGAAAPVPPVPPVPPAADSAQAGPPQAGRDQPEAAASETADAPPRAARPDQSPAAPAEPDLAYLDEDDELNLDDLDLDGLDLDDHSPRREESPGYSGAGDRDAVVAEEIFAAPPADDDLADDDLADDDLAGRPPGPQPAFHRMWSSPTPPGDEGED
jgi:hypothetical protein